MPIASPVKGIASAGGRTGGGGGCSCSSGQLSSFVGGISSPVLGYSSGVGCSCEADDSEAAGATEFSVGAAGSPPLDGLGRLVAIGTTGSTDCPPGTSCERYVCTRGGRRDPCIVALNACRPTRRAYNCGPNCIKVIHTHQYPGIRFVLAPRGGLRPVSVPDTCCTGILVVECIPRPRPQ